MTEFNQILTSLNLCTSDTRDDALKSILKAALYERKESATTFELINSIKDIYNFIPHETEVKLTLDQLDDLGEIVKDRDKYKLHDSEYAKLKQIELLAKSEEDKRCENFKAFLHSNFSNEIENDDYEIIWKAFLQYLFQCFFQYGEKANSYVNPKYSKDQRFNNTEILHAVLNDIGRLDLNEILKFSIDHFPEFATDDDIDFIDEIGQKTLSFSSLGLDPEVASESFKTDLIDWVFFLDTNFLFSVLDLHANVEDDACKELLKLIANNPDYIKIKLYYTDLTLKELRNKKVDFTGLDETLTRPAIRALLRSDELDEFSKRFYEKLLADKENTLHPERIVDMASITLQSRQITVYNTSVQRNHLGEEYLGIKITEYQRYIDQVNENRRAAYISKTQLKPPREIFRSDRQKEHDITLREIISLLRAKKKGSYQTLNNVKYFGVTLDELLIRYDNTEIRKKGDVEYPMFFKPSYLLNSLIKLLPVKTDNYKKAFIKAVSARGFYKDSKRSTDIIKMVAYLKSQGVDNEDLLLNLIFEKVFLDKYKEESSKDNFDGKGFIENEINRIYNEKENELSKTKIELESLQNENNEHNLEIKKLLQSKEHSETQIKLYDISLKRLQNKVTTLEGRLENSAIAPSINFGEEEQKKKNFELETQLNTEKIKRLTVENKLRKPKREKFIKLKVRNWRLQAYVLFGFTLILFLGAIFMMYSKDKNSNPNPNEFISNSLWTTILVWMFGIVVNVFTGKLVYDRLWNETFNKVFKEKIVIPDDLKELVDVDELD